MGEYHGGVRLVPWLTCLPLVAGSTYHRDVEPLMQRRCQTCHRAGEIGPMPLTSFAEVRPLASSPWQKARKTEHAGESACATSKEEEIGDRADSPPPAKFVDGWRIAKPDAVFRIPEAQAVPSSGTLDYQYILVPTHFTEDKWVEMAEVRPGDRSVVHHAIVYVRPPGAYGGGADWFGSRQYLAGYAPGMHPQIWKPGQARLIPAGSELIFQLHYTANGKATQDQTQVGLVFAKTPPRERIVAMSTGNRFRAVYPAGKSELLLRVPRYDFNWQPYYYLSEPRRMPAGTRIECSARYDNSPNNPRNPDPSATVRWGEQSWDEMMIGWFDVAVPVK